MDIIKAAEATQRLIEERPGCWLEGPLSQEHTIYLLCSIRAMNVTGDKAHRWLGWAQAAVCMSGIADLEELKAVNKV